MRSRVTAIIGALRSARGVPGVVAIVIITTALLYWVMQLWDASLRAPLGYSGDSNSHHMVIKSVLEGGWYYHNSRLGAPFGQELLDFPIADNFHLVTFKLFGWLSGNQSGVVMNLAFLGGFLLIAVCSFLVLRALRISAPFAVAGAVLYAFLPYHFERGTAHLFLVSYFAIPLVVLVLLRQIGDRPAFVGDEVISGTTARRWLWRDRRTLFAIFVCLLVATTGFYYGFFSALLLGLAALSQFAVDRDRQRLSSSLLLCGLIAIILLASLVPTFFYVWQNGSNEAGRRSYHDVELYGLKPLHLVLPIQSHRIELLRSLMERANQVPLQSEPGQNLGLVGAVGLVGLIFSSLARLVRSGQVEPSSDGRVFASLRMLTVGAIFLGTTGGFGAVMGVLGFTSIRAWNRISIFIGFFALAAVSLYLDRWQRGRALPPVLSGAVATLVMVLGVLDQTAPLETFSYQSIVESWESDRNFVSEIERTLGSGAEVFQVPYVPFPEHPPVERMDDYDHMRGYIHSEDLRWSYGGMKGREPPWQERLVAETTPVMVSGLVVAGFEGLYIDRFGYSDEGAAFEAAVGKILGQNVVVSKNRRLSFFDLRALREKLRAALSPDESRKLRDVVLHPLEVNYAAGFKGAESHGTSTWQWAGRKAVLQLLNPSEEPRPVTLEMELRTGHPTPAVVRIDGPVNIEELQVSSSTGHYTRDLVLSPGKTLLRISTDAPRVSAPADPRILHLQLLNLHFIDWRFEQLREILQ
jgi:phosphoglycerol transferase